MIQLVLFVATCFTTTLAGVEWTSGGVQPGGESSWLNGLPYSLSIMFVLSCHEFGHYFAARYHGVSATLPYYIPIPSLPGFLNFGTMGAVIRTRSPIADNKVMFDIGVYGPIAGFIASLAILIYGYTHLPPIDYLLAIHPDYFSPTYGQGFLSLEFGDTLLFAFLRTALTDSNQFIPPMSEVYHYPYLCVGWFGLFITAMNMIPVGQLDGGHIIYSMFGPVVHRRIARLSMCLLICLGILGVGQIFGFSVTVSGSAFRVGWLGWAFWALILWVVIKVQHPPVEEFKPLGGRRMCLGYASLIILLLSFPPSPFIATVQ